MQTIITLSSQVPTPNTSNYEVFEITFEVSSQQINLSTCFRQKPDDITGYCATSVVITQLKDVPDMFSGPFNWLGVKTSVNDSNACRAELIKLFFKACQKHKHLIQYT